MDIIIEDEPMVVQVPPQQPVAAPVAALPAGTVLAPPPPAADPAVPALSQRDLFKLIDPPAKFTGEQNDKIVKWLNIMIDWYAGMGVQHPQQQLLHASGRLTGKAHNWWLSLNRDMKPQVFPDFAQLITEQFHDVNAADHARIHLLNLKQKGAVQEYNSEFMDALTDIADTMADADQLFYYKQGLKPVIRKEVNVRMPDTLREAQAIAVKLDSAMDVSYERVHSTPAAAIPAGLTAIGVREQRFSQKRKGSTVAEKAAKINSTEALWLERREKRLCYKCGSADHGIKQCPIHLKASTAPPPQQDFQSAQLKI
jgi:hypothetical protein